MRRLLLVAALVAGVLTLPAVGAMAESGDSAAQQAASAIAAARQQANDAAQAWEDAKVELEGLEAEEAQVKQDQTDLQAEVDALSTAVSEIAVNRFVSGSTSGIPLLNGFSGPNDQAQAEVLLGIINDSSSVQLNEYEVASDDLDDKSKELQSAQEKTRKAQAALEASQQRAEERVVHLQEVEEQRLKDEAIRKEVERIQAEQRAKEAAERAAQQRAAAAQAAAAITQTAVPQAAGPARGGGSDQSSTPTTKPAATTTEAPAQNDDPNDDANEDADGGEESPPETRPPAPTTTTEAPSDDGEESYADGSIACPAPGSAFGDTWGSARSGGRRHEGVDMIGRLGMPLYAATSGSVQFKQTPLGGNSAWVNGDNGTRYFYAHLDGFEGSSRSVSRGELIGYMGHTGNANGVNHLHFEVHPGGGAAVNPYSTVRAVC